MGASHLDAYRAVRHRMCVIAVDLTAAELARTVPSCPDWTVHALLVHNVAIPAAIGAGHLPVGGNLQGWLDGLLAERAHQSIEALIAEWMTLDEVAGSVLSSTAVLLNDLATHEHDMRAAVGRPDHSALEADLVLPAALEALATGAIERGLGAVLVISPDGTWRSHEAEACWTIRTSAWEAYRSVGSRRTAGELLALPGDGDAGAFIPVIEAHLPLPLASLNEA